MRGSFPVILILFVIAVGYVLWHLWRITPSGWPVKLAVTAAFVLWFATMFAGFSLTENLPLREASIVYNLGHPWMIAFLYALILFLLADIAVLCRILPGSLLKDSLAGLLGVVTIVAAVMFAGSLHYHHKYRERLEIKTQKPLERPLNIVLASDLHLGYLNDRKEFARWVDLINAENPDLVLLAGDVADRSVRALREGGFVDEFNKISAPVYTGVTDAIYEKSWGHHVRSKTRYYISSGMGAWGAGMRVGSRSEYLVLHLY